MSFSIAVTSVARIFEEVTPHTPTLLSFYHVFGCSCTMRKTAGADGDGQRGIVSCIAFASGSPTMYACGSFSKSVGLYDDTTGQPWAVLEVEGGVTQVSLSHDGTML